MTLLTGAAAGLSPAEDIRRAKDLAANDEVGRKRQRRFVTMPRAQVGVADAPMPTLNLQGHIDQVPAFPPAHALRLTERSAACHALRAPRASMHTHPPLPDTAPPHPPTPLPAH
eukprot:1215476-Prymnesium_polylepis.1